MSDTERRFWAKVDTSGSCWTWTGNRTKDGYGQFWADGHLVRAHRWSYEALNGPITADAFVCHRCDNPSCVRPSHLFLGDNSVNQRDAGSKARHGLQRDHARAKRMSLAAASRQQRGSDRYNARLTEETVRLIRTSPLSGRALARELGVNYATVHRVRNGTSWGHVR